MVDVPARTGNYGPEVPSSVGDHQVKVDASDTAADFLRAKLAEGSNVTLTIVDLGGGFLGVRIDAAGGQVAGPPNAIAFYDGTGGISGDALLTALPLDQFGRPQIRDIRQAPGPTGAVWRQGAWQVDGDPQNVTGEGVVIYGPAANGLQDGANGAFARIKPTRFGIRYIIGGVDIGYAWRVDDVHEFFTDDAGNMTAEVVRATGAASFGKVTVGLPTANRSTWSTGNGDPNGAVVGSPGDLYTNTAGGANATLWVKESGAATNTGWVAK